MKIERTGPAHQIRTPDEEHILDRLQASADHQVMMPWMSSTYPELFREVDGDLAASDGALVYYGVPHQGCSVPVNSTAWWRMREIMARVLGGSDLSTITNDARYAPAPLYPLMVIRSDKCVFLPGVVRNMASDIYAMRSGHGGDSTLEQILLREMSALDTSFKYDYLDIADLIMDTSRVGGMLVMS